MPINLKDTYAIFAARYYVSQIPARVTFTGIGVAIGLQVLTSAWRALAVKEEQAGGTRGPAGENPRLEADLNHSEADR